MRRTEHDRRRRNPPPITFNDLVRSCRTFAAITTTLAAHATRSWNLLSAYARGNAPRRRPQAPGNAFAMTTIANSCGGSCSPTSRLSAPSARCINAIFRAAPPPRPSKRSYFVCASAALRPERAKGRAPDQRAIRAADARGLRAAAKTQARNRQSMVGQRSGEARQRLGGVP
jgi:hypothetical protein